ncbi:hypothetical protein [Acinetobacter johnsonii]|uniref:hypothetical protein n=1 Tax=Acinetobacter johnsonii TaxID=40214 RepID=UPI002492DEB8|nr:hypothetical protein [Acinetobacter johnsonii]
MRHIYIKEGELYEFSKEQLHLVDESFEAVTGDLYAQLITPKLSEFHNKWVDGEWIDQRTEQERNAYARTIMPTLTPIEFDLKLAEFELYDAVQTLVASNLQLKIAYTRATFFSRTDPFIDQARIALNLTDEQVDEMWMN